MLLTWLSFECKQILVYISSQAFEGFQEHWDLGQVSSHVQL